VCELVVVLGFCVLYVGVVLVFFVVFGLVEVV